GTLLLQLKESMQRIVTLPRPNYRYLESAQDFLAASGMTPSEPIENGTINDFVTGRFGDYLKYPFLSSQVSSYFTDTDTPNLKLLTAGQAPYDVEDTSFSLLVDRLSRNFDIVIMDTPPVAATSPTIGLSTQAQGVIFVIKADGYDLKIVRQATEQLDRIGSKMLGVVLNQVNIRQDETTAYYYGAYHR